MEIKEENGSDISLCSSLFALYSPLNLKGTRTRVKERIRNVCVCARASGNVFPFFSLSFQLLCLKSQTVLFNFRATVLSRHQHRGQKSKASLQTQAGGLLTGWTLAENALRNPKSSSLFIQSTRLGGTGGRKDYSRQMSSVPPLKFVQMNIHKTTRSSSYEGQTT